MLRQVQAILRDNGTRKRSLLRVTAAALDNSDYRPYTIAERGRVVRCSRLRRRRPRSSDNAPPRYRARCTCHHSRTATYEFHHRAARRRHFQCRRHIVVASGVVRHSPPATRHRLHPMHQRLTPSYRRPKDPWLNLRTRYGETPCWKHDSKTTPSHQFLRPRRHSHPAIRRAHSTIRSARVAALNAAIVVLATARKVFRRAGRSLRHPDVGAQPTARRHSAPPLPRLPSRRESTAWTIAPLRRISSGVYLALNFHTVRSGGRRPTHLPGNRCSLAPRTTDGPRRSASQHPGCAIRAARSHAPQSPAACSHHATVTRQRDCRTLSRRAQSHNEAK